VDACIWFHCYEIKANSHLPNVIFWSLFSHISTAPVFLIVREEKMKPAGVSAPQGMEAALIARELPQP
jgi:hypothetical protein